MEDQERDTYPDKHRRESKGFSLERFFPEQDMETTIDPTNIEGTAD